MSVCVPLVLTAVLLMLPWISERGARPFKRAPANPEIRGLLRVLAVLNSLYCSAVASIGDWQLRPAARRRSRDPDLESHLRY